MSQASRILLVIPAFKESQRLPRYLEALASSVKVGLPTMKLMVVDDGSGDFEQEHLMKIVRTLMESYSCILDPLLLPNNLGKGGAILAGWDAGVDKYDYLGFVDADGAIPASEVIALANLMTSSPREISFFGSRIKMLGKRIERGWTRHFSGRVFAFFVGLLIEPEIYDSQCGLKFIPSAHFRNIRNRLQGRRFAFDVELTAALRKVGHPIEEVPISWRDVPGSKVSLFRDTFRMLSDTLQIRKEMKQWTS
jgi:glycosyltransferase involved in cell wall biosynthesis